MNKYHILARGTLALHVIMFVWIFGGVPFEVRYPTYIPIHFWLMVVAIILQIAYKWQCILTVVEKKFLKRWDPEKVYAGACARYYAKKWFHITIPPKWIAAGLVIVFIYSLILYILYISKLLT